MKKIRNIFSWWKNNGRTEQDKGGQTTDGNNKELIGQWHFSTTGVSPFLTNQEAYDTANATFNPLFQAAWARTYLPSVPTRLRFCNEAVHPQFPSKMTYQWGLNERITHMLIFETPFLSVQLEYPEAKKESIWL